MTHAYGRHGPHAWKKWHQRRFEQPPFPPRIAVVFLSLPPTVERLVLVLMHDDTNDLDSQTADGNGQVVTATSSASRSTTTQQMRSDPMTLVGNLAFVQGNKKGTDDRERHMIVSQEELDNEAMRLSGEYAASPENRDLLLYDSPQMMEQFEERYKAGYLRGTKLKSMEDLPSRWSRMIQLQAYRDRIRDERKGDALSEDPLLAQAISYMLDTLGQRSSEVKRRAVDAVSIYLDAYRNIILEGQNGQDGDPFRIPSL